MNNIKPLPKITNLAQFHDDFFLTNQAVVLEGAARTMPAFTKWTDEYLLETLGEEQPKIKFANGKYGSIPISAFLQYLASPDTFEISGGPLYMTDYFVVPNYGFKHRETLGNDIVCPLPVTGNFAKWTTLYAGPPHTSTPMHQDAFQTCTWLAELRGEKTWRICAPTTLDRRTGRSFDAFSPEPSDIPVFEAILNPGDVIYMPPGWWHQVRNETTSTLAISGNFCTVEHAEKAISGMKAMTLDDEGKAWLKLFEDIAAVAKQDALDEATV